MPPRAVSVSQVTECGTVYRIDEIADLAATCRQRGLALHMDGARFANALVALGCSPAEMTWKQGVDILSFGATKNGCLMAEAIVVFDQALAESLAYRRKRAGQTISKGRLIAAQFEGYFANDHWLDNARHANRMAKLLSDGMTRSARAFASPGRPRPTRFSRSFPAPWTRRSAPRAQTTMRGPRPG